MIDAKTAPYGALLLRVSMGSLFIQHSVYLKDFVFGMTGAGKFIAT
jgi:putative oxidoreductase